MKNKYLFFCLLLLFSCKNLDYLYYYDNTKTAVEIEKEQNCQGIAELIRNNVLYNTKDSLYLFNVGLLQQSLMDYEDCLKNLTIEQKELLFGPAQFIYEESIPIYLSPKLESNQYNPPRYYNGLGMYRGFWKSEHSLKNQLLAGGNKFKKAKGYFKPNKYIIEGGNELGFECKNRKKQFGNQVFKNRKTDLIFVNSKLTYLTKDIQDKHSNLNCNSTFTELEINSLFGKPHLISKDSLFYQTIDTPYLDRSGVEPNSKGKVFCIYFSKTGFKNYYQYGEIMINPEKLK